jgi:hypothetical protein
MSRLEREQKKEILKELTIIDKMVTLVFILAGLFALLMGVFK